MNLPIEGSCMCKAIQFRITHEPFFSYVCHCLNCQKITGSAFKWTTLVLEEDLEILSGTPGALPGGVAVCNRCSSWLWTGLADTKLLFVLSGLLDNKLDLIPQAHMWTKRKQAWLQLDDETPQFEGNADMTLFWSESSLARAGLSMTDLTPGKR